MPIKSVNEIVQAHESGRTVLSSFRKAPTSVTTQGAWADLAIAAGNPRPQYYVGSELTATLFDGNRGLYHGQNVSPSTKYLHRFNVVCPTATSVPATFLLLDYLLFYPLVDMDSTDEQLLDNTITLPRYTDGSGVVAFLVATTPFTGGGTSTIKYTNQNGTEGHFSTAVTSPTASVAIGSLVTGGTSLAGAYSPFYPLASGDTGIRKIESITFSTPIGGVGVLVLAKVIAQVYATEITAPNEVFFAMNRSRMPQIQDGAYLNLIMQGNGSIASSVIMGEAEFMWG